MRNSEREDYLIRMIQEVGRALAGIRQRLFGGSAIESAVREDLDHAAEVLLGPDRAMLDRLDAESAVRLLANAPRTRQWIELLELDAESWRQAGDVERANRQSNRAREVRIAADRLQQL